MPTEAIQSRVLSSMVFAAISVVGQVPLPGTSSVSVALGPPAACRSCHALGEGEQSAYRTWVASPMGHAARNPLFLAALTEAEKDAQGVGDLCLRCHAPEAWLQGRCLPTDGSGLEPDDAGVTCSVCHRMDPGPFQRNGQYFIGEDLTMRGPYDDAVAPHAFQQFAFTSSSTLCGTCHDLRNPLVLRRDLDGELTDQPFPEQTTYTEWASSAFRTEQITCQNCHMPENEGVVGLGGPVRPDRSSHGFAGGNLFLLKAIEFLEPGLGIGPELINAQQRMLTVLAEAAELEVRSAPQMVARGQPFVMTFRVTNLAGHKLPTGYPEGRRVWLAVNGPDFELDRGAFDEASGEVVSPAALYHTVHGQQGLGPGHRLALNDTIYLDTRIPPRGFVATGTTAPVGKSYPEVSPGVLAHFDDVTVTATVPCDLADGSYEVTASLWYQSVTKRYVDALVKENGANPRGARLQLAFDEADPGPVEMVRISASLAVDPSQECDPPDSGVAPDTGNTDSGRVENDAGPADSGSMVEEEGCGCSATGRRPDGLGAIALITLLGLGRRRRTAKGLR